MNKKYLIKNINIVNEGSIITSDVLIENGLIKKIGVINDLESHVIDGTNQFLFPGIIDGQVHFREPGLTHKGDLYTESKAAVAGGTTSFIDMPNTVPNVLTMEILNDKYNIAAKQSLANYGFFLGVNGDNLDEVIKLDKSKLLGVSDDGLYFTKKGNLLADNPETMEKLFANCKSIIAIHSEKESIVEENENHYKNLYGEDVPVKFHPIIRSEQACYEATKRAIDIFSYVIMSNHIHLVCRRIDNDLNELLGRFKSYTSKQFIKEIKDNPRESRKKWLLQNFEDYTKRNKQYSNFHIWQYTSHPVYLYSIDFIKQKINYIHQNPVKAGYVNEAEHYK